MANINGFHRISYDLFSPHGTKRHDLFLSILILKSNLQLLLLYRYTCNICFKPNEYHRLQIICIPPQPIINHCFRLHTLISIQPIKNSSTSTSSRVSLYLVTSTRVHRNDHRQQQYNSGRSCKLVDPLC